VRKRIGIAFLLGSWRRRARTSPQMRAMTPATRKISRFSRNASKTSPKCSPMIEKSKYCSKKTFISAPAVSPTKKGRRPRRPFPYTPTASSATSFAFAQGEDFLRWRFLEPLFVDLGVFAAGEDTGKPFVDLFEQFGVVFGDRDSVRFFGRNFFGDFDAARFGSVGRDRGVDDHRGHRAGFQRVDRVGAFGVGPEFARFGFFLAEFEPGRALLGADRFAGQVFQAFDAAAFLDQDRLFGEVVG